MNKHQKDDWDALFDRLPVDTSVDEEHGERLKKQVLAAYDEAHSPRSRRLAISRMGEFLMRYKIPHWTAAAIVIAGMIWLTQQTATPALALDEVVDNFVKARSARYDAVATMTGQPTQRMKVYYLEPRHSRQELEGGHINIVDWQAGKMVGLNPDTKTATVFNFVNLPAESKAGLQTNQFDVLRLSLQEAVADPNAKVESLGEKELDGRTVVGFRFRQPVQPMTLWADPETKLPVRIEMTMAGPPQMQIVMSNYEFNVELDESLFSTEIPEGYNVVEAEFDASTPTEADFIATLTMCTKGSNKFPTGFDAAAIAQYVATYLVETYHQGEPTAKEQAPTADQMQDAAKIGRGFQFALSLPVESDAHYAGHGAKPGDADQPVFWYKPTGLTKYRVIYADLSIKESDSAPEVDGAKKLLE